MGMDNWRYGGRLVWGPLLEDPHYRWHENKGQFQKVVNRAPAPSPSHSTTPIPVERATAVETR